MSPLSPDELPADMHPLAPQPVMSTGSPGIAEAPRAPGAMPFERRQPQVQQRSVLPVEWFRRMPGGGTTYAPDDPAATGRLDDRG